MHFYRNSYSFYSTLTSLNHHRSRRPRRDLVLVPVHIVMIEHIFYDSFTVKIFSLVKRITCDLFAYLFQMFRKESLVECLAYLLYAQNLELSLMRPNFLLSQWFSKNSITVLVAIEVQRVVGQILEVDYPTSFLKQLRSMIHKNVYNFKWSYGLENISLFLATFL